MTNRKSKPTPSSNSFYNARHSFTNKQGLRNNRSSFNSIQDCGQSLYDESQQFKSCMGDDEEDVFMNLERFEDSQSIDDGQIV